MTNIRQPETNKNEEPESIINNYVSSKMLLSVLQKEYEYDLNNLNSIYSRTGILIAFLGIVLTQITLKYINVSIIKNTFINLKNNLFLLGGLFYSLCFLLGFVSMTISGYYFIKSILTSEYKRLDISEGFTAETCLRNEDEIAMFLMNKYSEIVNQNKPVMKLKATYYKSGVKFLVFAVISFITSVTMYYILV